MNKNTPPTSLSDKLISVIQNARVVSFDIFDTALVRATEKPIDAFLLLAHEIGIDNARAFAQARVEAEDQARKLAWQERRVVEISLEEIYSLLSDNPLLTGYAPIALIEQERALELRLCRRNPKVGEIFDWVVSLGKRVGFISDMYLDVTLIESMLAKHGYSGYEFLWVSSIEGVTKANGGLFQLALERLGVSSSELVHIGDNFDSDIEQARLAGIYAHHIPKCIDLLASASIARRLQRQLPRDQRIGFASYGITAKAPAIWKTVWRGLLAAQEAKKERDFWFDLGYSHVGILLLGYALWLGEQVQRVKPTQLYFLARDGHIMHAVHRCLWERGWIELPGHYLFASRRSLNIPAITCIDESTCDFLVSGTSRLTVEEFLSRIGLTTSESEEQILEAGFTGPNHLVVSGEDYGRLRMLFRNLAPKLLELAEEERHILRDYFQQEGLFEQQNIGLVDIGWHGTLQESVCRLLAMFQHDAPVTGFYMGTFAAARARVNAGAKQHAYVCEMGEPSERLAIIRASVEVFEWIFCAPHGSVIGFRRTDKGIEPRFDSVEFEKNRLDTAQRMQIGAMQFIRDALDCFSAPPPLISNEFALSLLGDLLHRPTAQEAQAIGDILHADGFSNAAKIRPIARPYIRPYNPLAWPDLFRDYRKTFWQAGYRRRIWPDCW